MGFIERKCEALQVGEQCTRLYFPNLSLRDRFHHFWLSITRSADPASESRASSPIRVSVEVAYHIPLVTLKLAVLERADILFS